MPLFYLWLMCIAGGVTAADYFLYEFTYWYIQGSAMLLIIFIAALSFGCGRVRFAKSEIMQAFEDEFEQPSCPAMVTRNGIQQTIVATELTVGDKILLAAGDVVPADCVIAFTEKDFIVNESMHTGEPDGVSKK